MKGNNSIPIFTNLPEGKTVQVTSLLSKISFEKEKALV
jgi:hypothetical protein